MKITNFSIDLDENTKKQFDECCAHEFVKSASLMPDAHSGYVAPIGSVFRTKGKIVPAWVGYDIGCGMIACKFEYENILDLVRENSEKIFDLVNEKIPMGTGKIGNHGDVSMITKRGFGVSLLNLQKRDYNDEIFKFIKTQALAHLGSLGSGNHFIELGYDSTGENKNELWLVIHSGSRGVGKKIATHYMKSAKKIDEVNKIPMESDLNTDEPMVQGDIFQNNLRNDFENTYALDVNSQDGKEYLSILQFGLEFALLNRLEMAYRVRDCLREILNLEKLDFEMWVNKNHNHCVPEANYFVHRKGATPAKLNERGVIPANMRDGCFLVKGKGNEDFLQSSSHGAGRKLSRGQARNLVSIDDFKKSMEGIKAPVDENRLDESPFAYKDIYDVMEAQKESVEIVSHILPIINWKG